ncbi:hypothetical protein BV20DRAFT_683227 [Pilatotrama ljubarskyi]|nr:hypothetical protein BV20DRAFT_683227 [Pilatotrama ljubarskyi]
MSSATLEAMKKRLRDMPEVKEKASFSAAIDRNSAPSICKQLPIQDSPGNARQAETIYGQGHPVQMWPYATYPQGSAPVIRYRQRSTHGVLPCQRGQYEHLTVLAANHKTHCDLGAPVLRLPLRNSPSMSAFRSVTLQDSAIGPLGEIAWLLDLSSPRTDRS